MSVIPEIGNQGLDLRVRHVLGVGVHDIVLAQFLAECLELVAQIVAVLSRDARDDAVALFAARQGARGALDGNGFYTYEPGDAGRWQKLFHEHAWEFKRLQERVQPHTEDGGDNR